MGTTLFVLLVLAGAAVYFMTDQARADLTRLGVIAARRTYRTLVRPSSSDEPFDLFLHERTPWPVVTPLLVALNVGTFARMLLGHAPLDDAATLIAWGANVAPRTTSGEWWRLVGATFVHGGIVHLVATMAALLSLGLVLERAVGGTAFAATYFAAGIAANVVLLWTMPATTVGIGASGAVFGIYGMALGSLIWALPGPSVVPVPLITAKRLAAVSVPFFLYSLLTQRLPGSAELAGFITGLAGGLVLARGVKREKPPMRRTAVLAAASLAIAVASIVPLRGVIDVTPEIARVAQAEERTATAYDEAVAKFKRGRLPANGLVQLIDRTIIPELQAASARLSKLRGVPDEQAPLVAAAKHYCELREQSWRRRAEGLRRSNMTMLRQAEQEERTALEAFQLIARSM